MTVKAGSWLSNLYINLYVNFLVQTVEYYQTLNIILKLNLLY